MVAKLSEMLVQFLTVSPREDTKDALLVRRHVTARFVNGLPERLSLLVAGHPALKAVLGSQSQKRIVQVGPLAFDARPYLAAAVDALAGGTIELRDESSTPCRIEAASECGQVIIRISSDRGSLAVSDAADAFEPGVS